MIKKRVWVYTIIFLLLLGGVTFYLHFSNKKFIVKKEEGETKSMASINNRPFVSLNVLNNGKTLVFITAGQSNASNHGDITAKDTATNGVYNLFNDTLFLATDPLLGCDGVGASVWTRMGKLLVNAGVCDHVVIIPIAVGGTSALDWAGSPDKQKKILDAFAMCQKNGLSVDYFIWLQGERDNYNNTKPEEYSNALQSIISMIRNSGVSSKILISITTFHNSEKNDRRIDLSLEEVQRSLLDTTNLVFVGPNTDKFIKDDYRWDGLHFSREGLQKVAIEYLKIIANLEGQDIDNFILQYQQ